LTTTFFPFVLEFLSTLLTTVAIVFSSLKGFPEFVINTRPVAVGSTAIPRSALFFITVLDNCFKLNGSGSGV